MKFPCLKRLNTKGAISVIAPLVVVVGIAALGTYALVDSHADTPVPPIEYVRISGQYGSTLTLDTQDTVTGKVTALASAMNPEGLSSATYSPDHKYLAWIASTGSQSTVYILNTDTNTKQAVTLPAQEWANSLVVWYPNDSRLAFTALAYVNNVNTYYLHTLSLSNDILTTVANVNAGSIISLAVSNDSTHIVYAGADSTGKNSGVYSVVPGAKPLLLHAGNCYTVRSVPTANDEVAYACTDPTSQKIYTSKPNALNATLIHSFPVAMAKVNDVAYSVTDIAPSPDGQTVAVLNTKSTVVDVATCQSTQQLQISTLPLRINAALTAVYSSLPSSPGIVCHGGGSSDSYSIQWSPDETELAYLSGTAIDQPTSTSLNLIPAIGGTPKQIAAASVENISW